ncbi:PilN domain-containing protein [Methylocaldum sp.]|uniref:PilN domain-containing protein n=1 Tax=Methylocaldum sp. TaxID=1969727 RepID=UPI002D46FE40|nr:PilN domain-containing protein [Methylocaldum sp.]HYE36276.1 PilN domain-containing protein [Methylocaldum sp.]
MARINLLPWRAELRKQRQKEFIAIALTALLSTGAILCFVHYYIGNMIDYQSQRNQYLESEIALLDKRIKEIEELEAKKKRLISKMEVIQQLQASRPEIVHLFDELARTIPEGVHLMDLTQLDNNLTMNGMAQSNARVSAYMRNLESSPWMKEPLLNIIETKQEAKEAKKERGNKFTLQVKQGGDKADSQEKNPS